MIAIYLPKPSKAAVSKPAGVMPRIHPEVNDPLPSVRPALRADREIRDDE